MNELTKSVLRRVTYQADTARINQRDLGSMEITEQELHSYYIHNFLNVLLTFYTAC
jgi:hypothetical protein